MFRKIEAARGDGDFFFCPLNARPFFADKFQFDSVFKLAIFNVGEFQEEEPQNGRGIFGGF